MRNRKIFEPPRFMSVRQAADQLIQISEIRAGGDCPGVKNDTLAIGVARVGQDDQKLVAATLEQLRDEVDMGKPLHSLVIPGHMHELELEAVEFIKHKN